jgi:hypothetical protein
MIAVGVDTHKERHYATALDLLGQLLGEFSFGATAAGYAELQRWAEDLGDAGELVFGIEGAGSWGAGLCEHLRQAGHAVLEVERPRRAERPAGKSDRIDALAAAQHVLVGEKVSTLRSRGIPSALRALLNVRRSTIAERTRLLNQLQALNVTAPVALRERIGDGTGKQLERRITVAPSAGRRRCRRARCLRRHARPRRTLPRTGSRRKTLRARARRTGPLARPHAPRRARDRTDLSRQAARLRSRSLQARSGLRSLQRNRAPTSLVR